MSLKLPVDFNEKKCEGENLVCDHLNKRCWAVLLSPSHVTHSALWMSYVSYWIRLVLAGSCLLSLTHAANKMHVPAPRYCSSFRKLVILFVLITEAVIVLWPGDIVFVVCSIVLSKGCKPFMWDLLHRPCSRHLPKWYFKNFVSAKCRLQTGNYFIHYINLPLRQGHLPLSSHHVPLSSNHLQLQFQFQFVYLPLRIMHQSIPAVPIPPPPGLTPGY